MIRKVLLLVYFTVAFAALGVWGASYLDVRPWRDCTPLGWNWCMHRGHVELTHDRTVDDDGGVTPFEYWLPGIAIQRSVRADQAELLEWEKKQTLLQASLPPPPDLSRVAITVAFWLPCAVLWAPPVVVLARRARHRVSCRRRGVCYQCGGALPGCGEGGRVECKCRIRVVGGRASRIVSRGLVAACVLVGASWPVSFLLYVEGVWRPDWAEFRLSAGVCDGAVRATWARGTLLGVSLPGPSFDVRVTPSSAVHRESDAGWMPQISRWSGGGVTLLTIPFWFVMAFLAVLAATVWLWQRRRTPPDGHCYVCGYNLTGNVSGVCPECGAEVWPSGVGGGCGVIGWRGARRTPRKSSAGGVLAAKTEGIRDREQLIDNLQIRRLTRVADTFSMS